MSKSYLISGASGFIGSHLCSFLENKGHKVYKLSRKKKEGYVFWNPKKEIINLEHKEFDNIINLAGKNIFCYWSKKNKSKILSSRLNSTKFLVKLINSKLKVSNFISMSAIGIYPLCGEFNEKSKLGDHFLASVCKAWEEEAFKAKCKTSIIRSGIVLDPKGGFFKKISPFLKLKLFPMIGNGENYFNLITLDKLINLIYSLNTNIKIKNGVEENIKQINFVKKQKCIPIKTPLFIYKKIDKEFTEQVLYNMQIIKTLS